MKLIASQQARDQPDTSSRSGRSSGHRSDERAGPWENAYVESFNGKLKDELIDRELF